MEAGRVADQAELEQAKEEAMAAGVLFV